MNDDDSALAEGLRGILTPYQHERLGVAVSGGSDSMALLHLLADWRADGGPELCAVTVNHGLRAGAAREAAGVARICGELGIPHETRVWAGWDHKGNLQDQARRARLRLIAQWAKDRGIAMVALGHTADDQAETFVMRLARGSGVDGLAAMSEWRNAEGITWVRPVLGVRRWELRDYLHRRAVRWFDDPTNEDDSFDRVKIRKALAVLDPLGITAKSLSQASSRLHSARVVLCQYAHDQARHFASVDAGDVVFVRSGLGTVLKETRNRLLVHALLWVSGAEYRPRQNAVETLWQAVEDQRSTALHGCRVLVTPEDIRITREYSAVKDIVAAPGMAWDSRWRVSGPLASGYEVRALGETGLLACPDWRDTGRTRTTLIASPAIWQAENLLAAPLAGLAAGWRVFLARADEDFFTSLIAH